MNSSLGRHFTVSIYIVKDDRVLLHKHKKAKILLPVGGHIETNELPEEAAVREVLEEAGIQIELYDADSLKGKDVNTEREKVIINPVHMVWGEVEKGHEHIDFIFYAKGMMEQLRPEVNESKLLKWYTEDELDTMQDSLLKDVYHMAKEAINLYKKDKELKNASRGH